MILPVESPQVFKEIVSDTIGKTRAFFSEETPLRNAEQFGGRPYERRIQQEQMAFSVAEALERSHHLCVEAPTGVGKSFAYLVPAIYHAIAVKKPVLITTETINLQEQLAQKDLPLLRDLTGLDFSFAIAKGRANYLCKRRLALALGDNTGEYLPLTGLKPALEELHDWARTTRDGTRSDISFRVEPQLWNCVCSEVATCQGSKCSHHATCFYWKTRHQWDKANLLITNHALFFTDLKIRAIEHQESCPLPPYCAVIFDEAHTIEDNAANHLGIHVNSSAFRFFLNRLYNPGNGRGLLLKPGERSMDLRAQVSRLHESADDFFAQFAKDMERSPERCFRIPPSAAVSYTDTVSTPIRDMTRVLSAYVDEQKDAEFKLELSAQIDKCTAFGDEISAFIHQELHDHVYWTEAHSSRETSGRAGARNHASAAAPGTAQHAAFSSSSSTDLYSAPLNVADLLHSLLFPRNPQVPVILTSATLAVNGSLDYFVNRVGFGNGEGLILDSPFDYQKQVQLFLSRTMPQPSEPDFSAAAVSRIKEFVLRTRGRAFVLFTSYSMLKFCAEKLTPFFRMEGLNLLVHGDSLSRTAMLREFKKNAGSVIFGATSFWTGVDVPGDALSNVIITKLPFSVPSHPLIAARCDRIREEGGEPFRDYSIPDAVLRFRQGIGRLIRSKTDSGIIVVLDPRILSKRYGRIFLDSIPLCPIQYY